MAIKTWNQRGACVSNKRNDCQFCPVGKVPLCVQRAERRKAHMFEPREAGQVCAFQLCELMMHRNFSTSDLLFFAPLSFDNQKKVEESNQLRFRDIINLSAPSQLRNRNVLLRSLHDGATEDAVSSDSCFVRLRRIRIRLEFNCGDARLSTA